MRSITRKHLSVVDGCARFAIVTIVELSRENDRASAQWPELILNGHLIQQLSDQDKKFIAAAVDGLREIETNVGHKGSSLRVHKIESSYVDMHPDAARCAAIDAATALMEGK